MPEARQKRISHPLTIHSFRASMRSPKVGKYGAKELDFI
jgi:hypothetical protein